MQRYIGTQHYEFILLRFSDIADFFLYLPIPPGISA